MRLAFLMAAPLIGSILLFGCPRGRDGVRAGVVISDNEVRTYIEQDLRPYLDSLAYQLCVVKRAATPKAPGGAICPVAEGYTHPPIDGRPIPAPDVK